MTRRRNAGRSFAAGFRWVTARLGTAFALTLGMVPTSQRNLARRYAAPTEMGDSNVVVIEHFSGKRSLSELTQVTEALVNRWDPALCVRLLVDLSDLSLETSGLSELYEYVRYVERIGLHQRAPVVALVANGDSTEELARLYQTLIGGKAPKLAVFTEVEAALAWIRSEQ